MVTMTTTDFGFDDGKNTTVVLRTGPRVPAGSRIFVRIKENALPPRARVTTDDVYYGAFDVTCECEWPREGTVSVLEESITRSEWYVTMEDGMKHKVRAYGQLRVDVSERRRLGRDVSTFVPTSWRFNASDFPESEEPKARLDDTVMVAAWGWTIRDQGSHEILERYVFNVPDCTLFKVDDFTVSSSVEHASCGGLSSVDGSQVDEENVNICAGLEAAVMTACVGDHFGLVVPNVAGAFAKEPVDGIATKGGYLEWDLEFIALQRATKPGLGDSTVAVRDSVSYANTKREEANELFSKQEYARALRRYDDAIEALERSRMSRGASARDVAELLTTDLIRLYINSATALSKMSRHREVKARCDCALELHPNAAKAMYRKALAMEALDDAHGAFDLLARAMELSNDRTIREAALRVQQTIKATNTRERDVCTKMMMMDKSTMSEDIMKEKSTTRGDGENQDKDEDATLAGRVANWNRRRRIALGALGIAGLFVVVSYVRQRESAAKLNM